MYKPEERIPEFAVTDWRGARVRVSIELPQLSNSMTSQMVIDSMDLELLKHLNYPSDIDLFEPDERRFELIKWQQNNEKAKRVVDILANKIALQIAHGIGEEKI